MSERTSNPGGATSDIDFRWAALALPNTFNQPKTVFPVVQLHQHPGGLVVAAVQILLYLVQRVVDIDAPLLIVPAVLGRQAHAVQQQAVQQLGVRRQALEAVPGDKLAGDAVERKLIALVTVVVIKGCFRGHVPALEKRQVENKTAGGIIRKHGWE